MSQASHGYGKKILMTMLVLFFLLFFWQEGVSRFSVSDVILPSPSAILSSVIEHRTELLRESVITMTEAVSGFLLGSLLGLTLAAWFAYSESAKETLYPYAIGLKAVPMYAMAPILAIWFGTGMEAKIVLAALVSFFPVLVGGVAGFEAATPNERSLFRLLGASRWQEFFLLRFPRSFTHIFPSLRIATTLSVVGAVVGEFMGSSRGLGHLIVEASYYLDTARMFAAVIIVSMIGLLFFGLVSWIEKRVVFWE